MSMMQRLVLDTNVLVAAILGPRGASRQVLRACLTGHYQVLMSTSLALEYEDVIAREDLFARCRLPRARREVLLDALFAISQWHRIYYLWRPNLPDEDDNHVLELAIAGNAHRIVTYNRTDFQHAELRFPQIRIVRPEDLLQERDDGNDDDSPAR